MRTVMRRWVDATIEQPALARIIHQESARPGPRFSYMYDTYIGPIQRLAQENILAVQAAGGVRPGPVSAAYFFLTTWGIGGLASSQELAAVAGAPGDDPREAAYEAIEIVIAGLRPVLTRGHAGTTIPFEPSTSTTVPGSAGPTHRPLR